MKKNYLLIMFISLTFHACKKHDNPNTTQEKEITNERNEFRHLKAPRSSKTVSETQVTGTRNFTTNNNAGCVTTLHAQSAEFSKLNILDPATDMMYIGSLMSGESIQNGTYNPVFFPESYVRKPVTYSVSIQGSTGSISKTIIPTLSNFRNSMQEIVNSEIIGEQPANITFELKRARSKKEIEMNINANLKFSTFFSSVANYNENDISSKSFYLLKVYQKFFSADIDIPQDGNLFTMPVDFSDITAPVYISTIDYGRSAYLMIESSYDSSRVKQSLEASFNVWKLSGGASLTQEQQAVMSEMTISGTIIGGSSTQAAQTIDGIEGFRNYVVNSANVTAESRGEIIAYKLRNLQNHAVYNTIINGDYHTTNCTSQLVNVNSFVAKSGGHHYLTTGTVNDFKYWRAEGPSFRAYSSSVGGAVPIYVAFNAQGRDHYYTSAGPLSGGYWTSEGIAFYAYKTQVPGSVPIYEHYSSIGIDHFFSRASSLAGTYWTHQSGVAFYAFQ